MSDNEMRGTLALTEPHPAAHAALKYLNEVLSDPLKAMQLREAFASCAIGDNRLAEICSETLRRALAGEKVSDRYLLGLCITVLQIEGKIK